MNSIYYNEFGNVVLWNESLTGLLDVQPQWTLIVEYIPENHLSLHEQIMNGSLRLHWNSITNEMWLDGNVLFDSNWATIAQAEYDAIANIGTSEATLKTAFSYIRQYIPQLKNLQLKLLGYVQTYGNSPDTFGQTELNAVYADLKTEFAKAENVYWYNRLKLFVKRRAVGQGISLANISALFTRINDGTETIQDKAMLWDAAETLIAQATTSAVLANLIKE